MADEFDTPFDLSDEAEDAFQPQVAINADGNAMLAWTRFDGPDFRIRCMRAA
jgi:hypothetical protein